MVDTIIIGGGPIGLNLAVKLKLDKKSFLLFECGEFLGGQLTNLYPEKEIVDIPGISSIIAKDYISLLVNKLDKTDFHLCEKVISIKEENNIIIVTSTKDKYECKNVVIATGLGFSHPRELGLPNEEKFPNQILYSLKSYKFLTNKRVAIFGGGDSALDWAKQVESIASETYLIHRRDEFRGNADTIKNCNSLSVILSFIPNRLLVDQNNHLRGIEIKSVKDDSLKELDVDYILVNYGNIASTDSFGFETTGAFINVKDNIVTNHIFAIGDGCSYPDKKRRIAPGLEEISKIYKYL